MANDAENLDFALSASENESKLKVTVNQGGAAAVTIVARSMAFGQVRFGPDRVKEKSTVEPLNE